ncbi:MAG: HTTM domain-containing protein [Neomegalonema sp.]|nr:HTTM domain-containing protein [Neomegalonema sp.]
MTLDLALRVSEIMLALAFILQGLEHIGARGRERTLYLTRTGLAAILLTGFLSPLICLMLWINALLLLHRFQGPYNGGSDRMGLLILTCITAANVAPTERLQEYAFGYLAMQLALSYIVSGWVKIVNPAWRSGQALQDVFLYSAYPVSGEVRALAARPALLLIAAWAVMLLELLFPLALATQATLAVALVATGLFHLSNAVLFGLNRFFWIWLAAYPSIIWLQQRLFAG